MAIHWLRLAVDPNDSGALAPKLRGMSEAIFVRIKRADDDPRAIDDGGLAP